MHILSNIRKLRKAYRSIYPNMPVLEFIKIAGVPTSRVGTLKDGILTWSDSVWRGVLRGGTICRKVVLLIQNGVIVKFSSENLDLTVW